MSCREPNSSKKIDQARILYIGYWSTNLDAPHQSMVTQWFKSKGIKFRLFSWDRPKSRLRRFKTPLGFSSSISYRIIKIKKLLTLHRGKAYSLYYVQGAQNCVPFLVVWFLSLGRKRSKLVYHTQDFISKKLSIYYWAEYFVCRLADKVIVNEVNRGRLLQTRVGLARQPLVIPTYLPLKYSALEWGDPSGVEALSGLVQLQNDEPGLRFVCAGGGPSDTRCSASVLNAMIELSDRFRIVFTGCTYDQLRDYIKTRGVERAVLEKVICLPRLPYVTMLRLFECCDVGLLVYPNDGPGNYYQSPGRFTEYISRGVSPVMSDFPSFRMLSAKYQIGALADPESPSCIKRAIVEASQKSNATERNRLSELFKSELHYEKNSDSQLSSLFEALKLA